MFFFFGKKSRGGYWKPVARKTSLLVCTRDDKCACWPADNYVVGIYLGHNNLVQIAWKGGGTQLTVRSSVRTVISEGPQLPPAVQKTWVQADNAFSLLHTLAMECTATDEGFPIRLLGLSYGPCEAIPQGLTGRCRVWETQFLVSTQLIVFVCGTGGWERPEQT